VRHFSLLLPKRYLLTVDQLNRFSSFNVKGPLAPYLLEFNGLTFSPLPSFSPQTVIFRNLGVTTSAAQLGYNLLNQCLSAFAAVSAAFLADTMPRRRALVWGTLFVSLSTLSIYLLFG
jgi:hypothetical protein